MIWTVMYVSVRRLLHSRVELLLTFVVPIAFFSIFALIFGGGIGSGVTPKIKVLAVDEVQSSVSEAMVDSLRENTGLRFMRDEEADSISRDTARDLVRTGAVTIAVVIASGGDEGQEITVDLLSDASDQVAPQVVSALVAKSWAVAQPKGPPVPMVPVPTVDGVDASTGSSVTDRVRVVDVIGEGKSNPVVSMYAAGIAVMFLLFGATGGGGALLEERENQTLDRLLSSQLSMDELLLGKWFYMTSLGLIQVGVMFAWAQLVFGVDVLGHLDGFLVMTVVTSLAASAFGLFLATLCRTRGQLNGLSVVLVLTMSALGGSMVPRYVMSEQMRGYGLWTFNAWALDGYDKVFWRELPVSALSPQLSVLLLCGLGFILAARILALRWETN